MDGRSFGLGGRSAGLPRPGGGGGAPSLKEDRRALHFQADLESVDPAVLAGVPVGTACTVTLHRQGGCDVVMVVAPSGRFVGTVSTLRGLSTIVDCGNVYSATVTAKTSNTCRVLVDRTATP